MSTTYILPDLPWAVLLGPITHDARPGDVIVVYTDAMREHVEQVVRAAGRGDLIVRQQDPPRFCCVDVGNSSKNVSLWQLEYDLIRSAG